MADTLSPNPTTALKQRAPMASRLQSPTSPFFLGSNDDKLERAQARAARAAAIRRKSVAPTADSSPPPDPCLGKQQILELFHNCIKLASENKINQKNTWELNLIDHICDLIKVEEEDDTETNFQKASCTLEAGVKIYSMRVDSVHSEAYKVLGGINRVGQENGQDNMVEDANINSGQDEGSAKKEQERKVSPSLTLESSFETLNVKKFDVAFAVDPLYHQTSAQFDEGGARGLLLNNLGVYGSCRVLFDSLEVPGKCTPWAIQHDTEDTIDISFAKECIEQMALNILRENEISPSLRNIVHQFDEDRRPSDAFGKPVEQIYEACNDNTGLHGDEFENYENLAFDHDDQASVVGEDSFGGDTVLPSHLEVLDKYLSTELENESFIFHDLDMDDRVEKVDGYLFLSLGFTSKQNAWAGPDHWKYRKAKGSEDPAKENESSLTTKRPRNKKQAEIDIDFTNALDNDISDVFAPPRNPKSLLLPVNRAPCNTTLPEDCHYQPEDLVKLFLLPNVMCLGRRGRNPPDDLLQQRDDYGPLPSWDDENMFGGQFDDGCVHSDIEDSSTLVSQPRQVNKIEVQYDKTAKVVDVHSLKETLWDHIRESTQLSFQGQEETVSFRHVLASFPIDCGAVAAREDISPHLCFICLLHLANEHGLSIRGCANLDDLSIHLPSHSSTFRGSVI